MKRFLMICLLLAATVGGCKCGDAPSVQQPPSPAPNPPEVTKVAKKFGEAEVVKYIGVQKDAIEAYRTALEDWKSGAGYGKPGETPLARFEADADVQKKYSLAVVALQEQAGLDERVARDVAALHRDVSRVHALYVKAGGDAALEDAERKLEAMEPESRAGSELAKAAAELRSLRDVADARARYTDEAVEAMVRHLPVLDEVAEVKANLAAELIGK